MTDANHLELEHRSKPSCRKDQAKGASYGSIIHIPHKVKAHAKQSRKKRSKRHKPDPSRIHPWLYFPFPCSTEGPRELGESERSRIKPATSKNHPMKRETDHIPRGSPKSREPDKIAPCPPSVRRNAGTGTCDEEDLTEHGRGSCDQPGIARSELPPFRTRGDTARPRGSGTGLEQRGRG